MSESINIEEREQGFKGWWDRNKKTVLIIGGTLLVAGAGYAVYKKWDIIKGVYVSIEPEPTMINIPKVSVGIRAQITEALPDQTETITKIINNGESFDVIRHVRNLPNGWKASPEKIEEAVNLGINLLENQTIVDPYIKNVA
jgi:hypothetical protein